MERSSAGAYLPDFLIELRERNVYHTGVAYTAGAFIVWQAADIVLPALGFPPSAMSFLVIAALVGFPVALVLAWLFEVVPDRRRDRPEPAAARGEDDVPPARKRPSRLWRLLLVTFGSAAFVACAGVAWTAVPRERMALPDGNDLLIARFENGTGDPLFDGTLDEALRVGLAQSPHLSLVPWARVRPVLEEMRRPDARLDEATAIEVALRSRIGAVLVPAIHRVGERFRITTRLVDPTTGETVVARSATAADVDGVLPALDELARQLRSDLGESLASMVRQSVPLDHATTASLEALQAWTQGNREWNAGRHTEAGVLYAEAVALDSTFAIAHSDLSQYYYWGESDPVAGARQMAVALRHADRVTGRERLQIQAKAAQWRGDFERATDLYRTLVARYPRDLDAWSNLGYQALRLGRAREGIEAYEHVVALDSLDASAWVNLATLLGAGEDRDRAIRLYEKAFRLAPAYRTVNNLNHEWGFTLAQSGRWAEAEAAFRLMLEGDADQRTQGHRSLGLLRMARGRFIEAAEHLRTAVRLADVGGGVTTRLRNRCYLVDALDLAGRPIDRELQEALDLADEYPVPSWFTAVLGGHLIRAGRVQAARTVLDSARTRLDDDPGNRAATERLAGQLAGVTDPAAAVEHFRAGLAMAPREGITHFALAETLEGMGDTAGAEAHYRDVLAVELPGNEALVPSILAHYRLARLLEATGRPEEARASYRRFLEIWGDGDPAIPQVEDARGRLAALDSA